MNALIMENDFVKMNNIENVRLIRVKDKNHNLLIMKDYWPVVGQINGSITIEADETLQLDNIEGFYALSHNTFWVIIRKRVSL